MQLNTVKVRKWLTNAPTIATIITSFNKKAFKYSLIHSFFLMCHDMRFTVNAFPTDYMHFTSFNSGYAQENFLLLFLLILIFFTACTILLCECNATKSNNRSKQQRIGRQRMEINIIYYFSHKEHSTIIN